MIVFNTVGLPFIRILRHEVVDHEADAQCRDDTLLLFPEHRVTGIHENEVQDVQYASDSDEVGVLDLAKVERRVCVGD